MAPSKIAASVTVRAIGPAVSWLWAIGMIPVRLNRPRVGLMPTRPFVWAGQMIEPSVSVPTAPAQRFAATAAPEPEDEPHAEATTPSGLRVAWDSAELIRRIDPEWTEPSGGYRVALAFLCPDPASVDAKYEELAALGFGHKDPWDAFWGQRYASVNDPDGNQVDLFAPL